MAKHFRYDDETALVQTTGGIVHGYEYDGISIFKGIPYAHAERFKDPVPASWEGVFEATGYGYACSVIDEGGLPKQLEFTERVTLKSEDCQNLNIFTPGCDDRKRPVMVWLHGGAMSFGSCWGDEICDADNLARFGGVVSVSLNHRLNALGFCDLSDFGDEYKNSGNESIADMVMALQFIHDNISLFGGDPDNVTIFGQSGGGMKVTALMQTPAADGLYQKAIIMSGVQGGALTDCVGSGRPMAEYLMKELGLSTVEELAKAPWEDFREAFKKMRKEYRYHGINAGEMPFRNSYYFGDPLECGFRPENSRIPVLVGTVYGEFDAIATRQLRRDRMSEEEMLERLVKAFGKEFTDAALPLFRAAYPERPIIDLLSLDCMFRALTIDYTKKRSALNECTWEYLFNLDMPSMGGCVPMHGNDLSFFFHTTDRAPGVQEPGVTEKIEEEFFGAVMAFVRNGDPNHPGLPVWKPSRPDELNTMVFDRGTRVRTNFDLALNELLVEKKLKPQLEGIYASVTKS